MTSPTCGPDLSGAPSEGVDAAQPQLGAVPPGSSQLRVARPLSSAPRSADRLDTGASDDVAQEHPRSRLVRSVCLRRVRLDRQERRGGDAARLGRVQRLLHAAVHRGRPRRPARGVDPRRAARTGSGSSRCASNPEVVVRRGDRDVAYRATVWSGDSSHERVDRLFRSKYGVIDRAGGLVLPPRRRADPPRAERPVRERLLKLADHGAADRVARAERADHAEVAGCEVVAVAVECDHRARGARVGELVEDHRRLVAARPAGRAPSSRSAGSSRDWPGAATCAAAGRREAELAQVVADQRPPPSGTPRGTRAGRSGGTPARPGRAARPRTSSGSRSRCGCCSRSAWRAACRAPRTAPPRGTRPRARRPPRCTRRRR